MEPTLVAGLLTVAGTLASGVLGLAGLLVKRHLAFLSKLEANDDAKTAALGTIASELTRTREVQQTHAGRLDSLEKKIEDKRQEDATAAQKEATALMRTSLATITGRHAAVNEARAEIMGEEDEAPEEGPRTVRRRDGSRPR